MSVLYTWKHVRFRPCAVDAWARFWPTQSYFARSRFFLSLPLPPPLFFCPRTAKTRSGDEISCDMGAWNLWKSTGRTREGVWRSLGRCGKGCNKGAWNLWKSAGRTREGAWRLWRRCRKGCDKGAWNLWKSTGRTQEGVWRSLGRCGKGYDWGAWNLWKSAVKTREGVWRSFGRCGKKYDKGAWNLWKSAGRTWESAWRLGKIKGGKGPKKTAGSSWGGCGNDAGRLSEGCEKWATRRLFV